MGVEKHLDLDWYQDSGDTRPGVEKHLDLDWYQEAGDTRSSVGVERYLDLDWMTATGDTRSRCTDRAGLYTRLEILYLANRSGGTRLREMRIFGRTSERDNMR